MNMDNRAEIKTGLHGKQKKQNKKEPKTRSKAVLEKNSVRSLKGDRNTCDIQPAGGLTGRIMSADDMNLQ